MKDYLPKNKYDVDAIEHLRITSFDVARSDIEELLIWFQDLNWTVTNGIGDYLAPYVNEIKNELIEILKGNDEPWKLGVLVGLIVKSPNKLHKDLLFQIKRIAENPKATEKDDYVDLAAQRIVMNQSA